MTMEYKAGHYFKRLTMIDMAFGDADHHLRELAKARRVELTVDPGRSAQRESRDQSCNWRAAVPDIAPIAKSPG